MREILFILVVFWSLSEGVYPPRRFSHPGLSHLVIPRKGRYLYVGGTNSLSQLNWELEVKNSLNTGPKQDSPLCHASGCESGLNVSTPLTDNVNKALVYDPENRKIIYCGSLHQGSCWKYEAQNISKDPSFIPEAVAANDEHSSTYAFIGPQRYNRWGHGNVLYVGTTFTARGDYRHDVPAISSRNLHNLRYAESNIAKQSLLRIDVKYRDRFLVKYVYGFNTSDHIYFITVQKKSHLPGEDANEKYVTRLARICISDANYDTYTEITLECNHRGELFNIVKDIEFIESERPSLSDQLSLSTNDSILMGLFSKEGRMQEDGKVYGNESALCVYSVANIEQQFEENLHKCFNGSMRYRNMEYISGPIQEGKCPNIGTMGNIDDFCKVGLKISGSSVIQEEAYGIIEDNVTTFTQTELNRIPIILTGTYDGKVVLSSLASPGNIKQLQTLQGSTAPGLPILDLHLVDDEVVTLQEDSLSIFNASNCNQFSSCGDCLKAHNPFCGWCALHNKCTLKSLCNMDDSQWFSPGVNNRCIHLEKISPSALSVSHSVANIHLHVQSLPTLPQGQKFLCVFNDEVRLEAEYVATGLTCPNPLVNGGRRWRNAENISLSIAFTGSRTTLLDSLTIPLYDCSKQRSCRQCSATYDCLWCLETSTCLSSQMECPSTALMDYRSLIHKYPCPALDLMSIPKIPNDVLVGLKLPFQNRLPSVYKTTLKYWCLVSIENAKFKVSANLVDSTINCEATQYNYFADVAEMTASLIVLVNDNDIIDKANITIFKCSVIGTDCSLCKSSDSSYGCNWCNGACASNCNESSTYCPKPEIKEISPRSGPLEGGTPIEFMGTNLAIHKQDAIDKIYLGNKKCHFLNFKISVSLSCRNGPVIIPKNVSVLYDGHYSPLFFEYKDYYITHISPSKGPMAGGTTISISGVNLDIGTNVKIFLDRVPCHLKLPRHSNLLHCVISGVGLTTQTKVIYLMIDGAKRTYRHSFSFTPNPVIHEIKPTSSFFSGGRIITVHGEHFDSVQEPEMLLHTKAGNSFVESSCYILNSRIMECETPSVQNILHNQVFRNNTNKATVSASTASNFHQFDVGFKMDNVTELLFLSKSYPNVDSKISFYEDPKYYPFGEGIKKYKGDELVLEGSKLNLASNQHDVEVNIGTKYCNVTSLTESQLVCFPPLLSDSSEMPFYNGRPMNVVVKVGKSLRFNLGEIVYDFNDHASFSTEVIGGISAAAAILIFVAALGLILYRHKSSQAEREYKRIQIQMDTLENNVRSECKQAFAELQTDMTDLTSELETSGIPIREHRKYIMNVFFPGVTDHPILNVSSEIEDRKSYSLSQMDQLIHNKCFLLTLIDTLEKQPSFSIRDRVNFASLFTVATLTNMEYLTDILRTLLLRLIEKSLQTRHPQLMLRRTESVVEKLLTNWLALCLYGYMKDYAGSSLFLLFKAIKYQIEKGPVDFITQEAKYSLSESGLLREPISYSVITCYVLQREFEEAFQTRVLDCDTISQVKSKILNAVYKNTPFSMRPSVDEIDLEWQCGQDAHVVLQDFDLTTKESSVGKRVNTLAHYGVKGRAVVSLVPKQMYNRSIGGENDLSNSKCFLYHLKEPESTLSGKSSNGTLKSHKSIPEVFLTRLLSTKGTLQKFIDDFFATVFSINSKFPPIVKWLYDIFDDAAIAHNVNSPEIIHSWKSNSVPLRFWVNIIKNPDFIFDIEKTYTSDSNLSIIAQAFMDSSSATEPKLNKESPSHKLLFAKDITDYRGLIRESYELIRNMPQISDQDLNYYMHGLSSFHEGKFNQSAALRELFMYVDQYYHDVYSALNENKLSKHLGLADKLEDIYKTL
uniref:PlexinBlike [Acyrthosiphon pisum] n=1 Tax=Lepeophtheirus salmonis TaxID=72036 RepID=A0A0K2UN22_LEPSM